MNWIAVLGIALGLAMDAFAVSIASGLKLSRITPRHVFRLSFHFGLFQFLMPVIGWCIGSQMAAFIAGFDHWIAFGLLALVGGRMLWEAGSEKEPETKTDPTRGMLLVALSLATSIDALAVGLSLAMLRVPVLLPSVSIGVITAAVSAAGIVFGARLAGRFGRYAEIFGGVILLVVAVRIVLAHTVLAGT